MTTDKHELDDLSISVQGWDTIMDANMEIIDDGIENLLILEAGEAVDAYEVVMIASDGDLELAQANGTLQPVFGIMIEDVALAAEGRVKVRGEITNSGWTWSGIGNYIYLDPSTPGALTETRPAIISVFEKVSIPGCIK